ncbi:MAG TPA: tetratricopeptide repeat protein [Granulicella sp.]|jgi:tetratricopeptide (TPR) repeat protein|nr:tetratricopeptide repeat protein [Granulicella sp.]
MTLHLRSSVTSSCRRLLPFAGLCLTAQMLGLTSQMLAAQTLKHHPEQSAAATVSSAPAPAGTPDHGSSYYHYGLAHLYEDLAVNAGRPDYATQAVEEYKLALDADPNSALLQDGLAGLYFKVGRIREAVTAAKDQIARHPNDLEAHKLLGKVYLRSLGDMQGAQSNDMLQLALGEYETMAKLQPNDLETHLLLGQLYGLNHDSAKAEAQFKLAEKIDANSEEAILNMARLYSVQGEMQRAIDTLNAIPESDRTAREEFALAASYDQVRKPKEAAAAYRRSLDLEPDNLDGQRGLANALMTEGQFDEALKVFGEVLAAEPNDVQSQIHVSEIERRQGHYDQALETLKKAKDLAKGGSDPELDYNEALIDDSLGRYDDAIAVLKGLLVSTAEQDGKYSDSEKSNRAVFLDRLAIVYGEQNDTADAVKVCQQEIALGGEFVSRGYQGEVDAYRAAHQWKEATAAAAEAAKALPQDKSVQLMYAGELADTGKVDEGIALAKAQLKGSPDDRDVEEALATIDLRLKRWSDAQAHLDKAEALITRSEDRLYLYFLRGELADRQKRYEEAEADFKKALEIDPQNPTILNYLGYMNADRGVKLSEALGQIKKAVELDPQNYAFLDSLGWVYFKLGQYSEATTNLQKAVERSASDPTVHDHLGELYEKTGKLKQAVAQWERSMTEYAHSLPADADPVEVAKVQHKLEGARVKLARVNTTAEKTAK